MALGDALLRFAGGFSGATRQQQPASTSGRDDLLERLVKLRQMVPDNSREAREIDTKLVELQPELATQRESTPVMSESGFIQHMPGGVGSVVSQDPEQARERAAQQRDEALRRSVAAQINRMQRLPEEMRQSQAQIAMASEDPEQVLQDTREMGRLGVNSAQGAFSNQLQERTGDGNFVAVRTDQGVMRQSRDEQGNIRLETPPSDFRLVDTQVRGTAEEVDLSSSEETSLRDQQVATMNFVDTTRDALGLLQENPDVNTWTARGAALVNDLQQESKALARATGIEFDENILDPSQYQDTFDNLGIQSERMKSLFVSLAFQAATASGQTGRSVSDKDVQRFMQQVGQQSSDPRALAATLRDIAERTVNSFRNSFQVRRNQEFEGDLGLSSLPSFEGGGEVQLDAETEALLEKYE